MAGRDVLPPDGNLLNFVLVNNKDWIWEYFLEGWGPVLLLKKGDVCGIGIFSSGKVVFVIKVFFLYFIEKKIFTMHFIAWFSVIIIIYYLF